MVVFIGVRDLTADNPYYDNQPIVSSSITFAHGSAINEQKSIPLQIFASNTLTEMPMAITAYGANDFYWGLFHYIRTGIPMERAPI